MPREPGGQRTIRREELEALLDLTDETIQSWDQPEMLENMRFVVNALLILEGKVKLLNKVFGRYKKLRLDEYMDEFVGSIVQLGDVLLRKGERKPGVPYKKVLTALIKAKPEIKKLVDEITEMEMSKLSPTQVVEKRMKGEEPKTWKEQPVVTPELKKKGFFTRPPRRFIAMEEISDVELKALENQIKSMTNRVKKLISLFEAIPAAKDEKAPAAKDEPMEMAASYRYRGRIRRAFAKYEEVISEIKNLHGEDADPEAVGNDLIVLVLELMALERLQEQAEAVSEWQFKNPLWIKAVPNTKLTGAFIKKMQDKIPQGQQPLIDYVVPLLRAAHLNAVANAIETQINKLKEKAASANPAKVKYRGATYVREPQAPKSVMYKGAKYVRADLRTADIGGYLNQSNNPALGAKIKYSFLLGHSLVGQNGRSGVLYFDENGDLLGWGTSADSVPGYRLDYVEPAETTHRLKIEPGGFKRQPEHDLSNYKD